MVAATLTNYISLDERGVAYLAGTRLKVRQIVIARRDWQMTAEEIQKNYDFLSLAQVYAALAYYHDHQSEIDSEIERVFSTVEALHSQNPNPLTREDFEQRLRSSLEN